MLGPEACGQRSFLVAGATCKATSRKRFRKGSLTMVAGIECTLNPKPLALPRPSPPPFHPTIQGFVPFWDRDS